MPRGLAGLRPLLISSGEQYLTVAIERAEREKLAGYLAAQRGGGRGESYLASKIARERIWREFSGKLNRSRGSIL